MSKRTITKLTAAAILLIVTVITLLMDYVAIYPSTMVGFLVIIVLICDEGISKTVSTKAAHYSVIIFSGLVMALNFFTTIFLPIISSSTDLSGISVELTTSLGTTDNAVVADHFVEVTMNDMHEFCYITTLLLTIYIILMVLYRRGAKRKLRSA